ncbi:hypothetical protein BDZ45DRAFT_691772 [Acephala macrosclerotiorum]|nr:hypothetical protein BDZ45DRAFT_691772 [Acephala macrosclerotiorum]
MALYIIILALASQHRSSPTISSSFDNPILNDLPVCWCGVPAFEWDTHFSTKWSFLAFFFVFELGSALCGAAQSSAMFIIGRAIADLGFSGLANGALATIAAILPPHRQPMVMGFYVNLLPGIVVAVLLTLLCIPDAQLKSPIREVLGTSIHSLDLFGFVLIALALLMFFVALQYGGSQYAWNNSTVIGLFIGAVVTFVLFLLWEYRRGDDAMMPIFMLRKRII